MKAFFRGIIKDFGDNIAIAAFAILIVGWLCNFHNEEYLVNYFICLGVTCILSGSNEYKQELDRNARKIQNRH